jgi:hypothetical protein
MQRLKGAPTPISGGTGWVESIHKHSNFNGGKLVGRNEKRARRRVFTSLMAEWTGIVVKLKNLLYASFCLDLIQQHVVKTCGKLNLLTSTSNKNGKKTV